MAIYKINNDVYDIPKDVVSDFERDNPDAVISYRVGKDLYEIPLHEKSGFLKHFPDAVSLIEEPVDTSMDFVTPKPRVDVTGPVPAQPEYKNPLTNTPEYNLESIRQSGAIETVKGERDDKGRLRAAVAEKRASVVPELDQAIEDVEESKRKYRKEHPVLSALSGFRGSMAPSVEGIHINDPKFRNLSTASQLLKESEKFLARHNGGSGVIEGTKSVIEGAKEAASDLNTYSMGLTEMLDNTNVLSAITKFEKGEELSPDEQHLLDAVAINMSAQAVAGDPDLGHLMGSAFVESIPFMVEMMMNPISGAGEGLGKAMTKYALKRFGKEAGSKALEKGAKIAGRVAGDAMAATGMSATSGIVGVAADATARMTGAPVYTNDFGEVSFGDVARDENGEMILDGNGKPVPVGSVGKESEGKALYKAFTSRSIENFSEMFGEYFGMAGKTLMNTTLGKKISSSALIRSMDAFTTADWTKQFNQILKDGKYNGFIGETAEEYVGGLLNAAFVGDQSFEDLASTDNLVQTVAAVGLMSGIFGSVNLAGIRLTRYKARKDLEKSEKEAYNLLGEDFDVLRDNISSLDPDAQEDAVKNVLASPDLDRDQKEAVLDYFHKQSYYNGLKFGENKRIEEAVQAETEAVRAESNPGTGMYIEASRIDPLSGERIPGTIEQGTIDDERVIWKGPDGKKQMIPKTEIDRSTVRSAPIQEVIDASVEAVRESEQAKIDQDSRYSPDIPEPQLESTFTVNGKKYMFTQPTPEGWFLAQEVKEDGSLGAVTDEFDKTAYFDAKQAEIDAAEAIQEQLIQEQRPNVGQGLAEELGDQQTVADDYSRFVDTGEVSEERVNDIASKIIRGEPLNTEEESMRAGVAQRVEDKLKEASNPINTSQITTENAIASPNEESNMSQNPAASEESAADVPDQDASTAIPADENGNLLYHQAPVEATLSDILDGSLDSDEIDAFVGENKKAATALLKKVSEKPPKMSTNKAKYLDQKKAWSDRVAEAEQQVSYWNDVESILKESRMKPGDKAAEEIKSMGEPVTGEELAAMMLANGSIKLTKESYKRETGAGEEEAKKMFGLFATPQNGGVSIERAGELVMLADLENDTNHFDQDDPNAGRNAIIEVLSSARTRGDLIDYVKNNREAMAERERQAEYNAYAEWCEEMFHMSPEEYDAYEELVMNDIVSRHLDEASYNELMSIFATEQNINEDDKKHDTEQSGAGEARQGSREILPSEESVPTGRVGRTEEGPESVDGSLDNENGVTYESASGEIDENGKLFVLSSDGTTTFGVIPQETGLTPAPIKLSEGFQNEENKGYGLRHIESNHGEQILGAGFPSIENFVETVAKGFTVIKKGNQRGGSDTYLLEVKDKHNNTLFVELSKDGSYWNVNSAGIFNERYSKKKDIVWTLPAVSSSTNADATGVNHGTTRGETVASGNSPQTISSGDKYNDISPQKQADDKKIFVSPERADDESLLDYAERITEAHKLFEEKPQTDHSLKENTNVGSEMLQKAPYTPIKPIGVGPFGPIYDQFRGKVKEAFDFLLDRKDGDLLGVFHRDDVGDIDLVWGEAKTKYTGKGLAHIIKKHIDTLHDFSSIDDAISTIDNVIKNGNIAYNGNNLEIGNNGYKVVIAQTDDKKWILTAFDNTKTKKEKLSSAITPGTPNGINGNRAVVPGDNLSRENKDNDISPENQTEKAKPFVSPERKEGENLLDYAERVTEAHKLFEGEPQTNLSLKENANAGSEMLQKAPYTSIKPIGIGILGSIFTQFKGNAKAAIEFLLNRKEGDAVAALFHKDVGDIDLYWGNEKAGLMKIARKHPEVLDNLQAILENMKVMKSSDNRIVLESDTHKAIVSKKLGDVETPNWLLSAYEKKEKNVSASSSDIETEPAGKENGTAAFLNVSFKNKDNDISSENQTEKEKVFVSPERKEGENLLDYAERISEAKNQYEKEDRHGKASVGQNRLVTDERYAELKRRMREKLGGQMNIGVDPEILAIGTEMAVYHIEKGARKFSAYAKAMISDLGDSIRPYLKAFYNGARELPEMEVLSREMDNYEDVRRFDVTNFDKLSTDILAMAETISKEQEVASQVKEAKRKKNPSGKKGKDKSLSLRKTDLFNQNIEEHEEVQRRNGRETKEVRTGSHEGSVGRGGPGNKSENLSVGRQTRKEVDGRDAGREVGGVHGSNGAHQDGSGGIHGLSSLAPSVKKELNQNNYHFDDNHLDIPAGDVSKLKANLSAIRTLHEVEDSGKPATEKQKEILSRYVGWGGLSNALNESKYSLRSHPWNADTNWNAKYLPFYEQLKEALTEEEFKSAIQSTTTSHYTPEPIIRSLWKIAERIGFKGGRVSEPAMGVGHIIGFMPKDISSRSWISGFEIDSLSGRISKVLYPDAHVRVEGYETEFTPRSKDLVITNVPFGKEVPYDKALDRTFRKKMGGAYNLHNYFIAKGLLELKEGGLGVFVTSSATMDGTDSRFREFVAGNGIDLIGAIRLPNNAFLKNAGTSVTADVLVFRRRGAGEASNGINFISTTPIGEGSYEEQGELRKKPLMVNEYFAGHPEMMLGDMMTAHDAGSGGLYSGASQTLKARPDLDLNQALSEAIDKLPKDILGRDSNVSADMMERTELSNGTLTVKDNKVYVSTAGVLEPISVKPTFMYQGKERSTADAIKDYNAIKDTLKRLILAEQSTDADPEPLRKQLNEEYDRFVDNYGTLNRNKALNDVFAEDNEHSLPLSLEKIEKIPSPSGKSILYQVSKGKGILNKRVSFPVVEPSKAANLQDAINISRSYRGTIDVPYIAQLINMSEEEAMEDMLRSGVAYRDPLTGNLVDKSVYLSGNVKEKLEEARAAADSNPEYEKNVADLASVQPDTIRFGDISYRLGTTWIPAEYLNKFAEDVAGIANANIQYISVVDEFVLGRSAYVSDFSKSGMYKTDRIGVIDLFAAALNQRKPKVYDEVNNHNPSTGTFSKTRVVNEVETQAAAEKIMELSDKFVEYIDGLTSAHKELERIYNDRYNNFRLREYELPSFEHYPHSNEEITLRAHQTKAVQRCLSESTLLAHQVGTGKTFTMVTTAMEMRRLGIAKKPMIVVQNATLEDFVKDFYKLYPGAHVLAPGKDERGAENRTRLFNLIATGDFDAIVIPQSFMQFIPDDEGRKKELIQKRIETYERVIEATEDESLKRRLQKDVDNLRDEFEGREKVKKSSVKEKAKAASRIKTKVERNLDRRTDEVMTFEQMGIDALFIDEAHNFKKIGFASKMSNVKGIDTGSSQRANSLLLKSTWIREKNNGRNVILATGTPITNTMAEVWTMMNFVAPDILEAYDMESFDEFATTFGTVEPSLEFTATGNFKIADRFKSYVNVPELVKAFRSHADVVLTKDVAEFEKDKSIPKLRGEQITNIVIDKNEDLQDVMQVLIKELEAYSNMSGQEKKKMSALPLVVFTKAKQAAIDLRLINPTYPDNPNSKTNQVVSNVIKLYKESEAEKGTQLVFCDSYQSPGEAPKMDLFGFDPDVPRFNLYEDIKQKLIEGGIPGKEIAIVNNYDGERRKGLFEKVRNGDVRVLLGSTEKMGVGVNVQDRLYGLHHIDAPLRPMDFEQRNGRILRQGNNYALWGKPVNVVTYGVQGTLDATAYDRLQIKQNFINQMMKGDVDGRIMEDQDDEDPSGMTFNQMAATLSGDKTAQLLFVAENKLKKLRNLKRGDANSKSGMAETVEYARRRILVLESKKKTYERIQKIIAEHFPRGVVNIKVEGKNIREKFASSLDPIIDSYEDAYSLNRGTPPLKMTLNAGQAEVVIHFDEGRMVYELYAGKEHVVEGRQFNGGRGLMSSIEHQLKAVENNLISVENEIASNQRKIEGLTKAINTSWGRENELKKAEQDVASLKKQLEEKAKANDEKKGRAEVENTASEGDILYRSVDEKSHSDLDKANRRFNLELQRQIDGTLPEGFIYQLGRPSEALQSAGIPNLPIELSSDRLAQKASKEYESGHPFSLESIKNLPEALNNPIAIFDARKKNGAKVVLTTLTENGNNFIAAIQVRRSDESRKIDIEVNSVRSLYPKDRKNGILEWINLGLMKWVDKKKASNFFSTQWPNYIASGKDTESISSATKIVENFQNPTPKQGEIVSEIDDLSSKLHTPVTIVNDVNEIADTNEKTQLRKRSSKGWYDLQTKEIVIVLPNNKGVADAQRTFLHEVVAHHGLRKLFGDDFDTFLSNVYANANEGIRREILRRTDGNPLRLHEATEEYLADLAERGFDNKEERSVWSRIKDAFIEMLRKVGVNLGFKLSDDDLRYILWRSYRNLEEGNLLDLAEDVSMKNKWGIGDYEVRFRAGRNEDGIAKEYEDALRKRNKLGINTYKAREAFQDSMLSVKIFQDILEKHSGKEVQSFENVYKHENQLSSYNMANWRDFEKKYYEPLTGALDKLIDYKSTTYDDLRDYIYAKSGLKRNEQYPVLKANRDLEEFKKEIDDKFNKGELTEKQYNKLIENAEEKRDQYIEEAADKDFSGLTGLMEEYNMRRKESYDDFKVFAEQIVADFEKRHNTDALWQAIKDFNDAILKKEHDTGLISTERLNSIKEHAYDYYLPLRGWEEEVASDFYEYMTQISPIQNIDKAMTGRTSMAFDPLATMRSMAQTAIVLGNRNRMKQKLYNLVVNRPSSLASVRDVWYVKNVNEEWEVSFPDFSEADSSDKMNKAIVDHEANMQELEKEGNAVRRSEKVNIGLRASKSQLNEHVVRVKINGCEYAIYVNADPRAAQALNGLLSNEKNKVLGLLPGYNKMKRLYGAGLTSYNPDFILANTVRDTHQATLLTFMKSGFPGVAKAVSNSPTVIKTVYRGIKGEFNPNSKYDVWFKEFLENGGETGYSQVLSLKDFGMNMRNRYAPSKLRKVGNELIAPMGYLGKWVENANRMAEDITRFNAYVLARKSGKSIVDSVDDAKNISVNFNRKGAGYATGGFWGTLAGVLNEFKLFFNPIIQGIDVLLKPSKEHRARFITTLLSQFSLGLLVALLNDLIDGDDDYWNQSDFNRMNNLMMRIPGTDNFVKIPLAPFFREIYGLGDVVYRMLTGRISSTDAAWDTVSQTVRMFSLDGIADPKMLLTPDLFSPLNDIKVNENFMGMPIAKQTLFNELDPEYKRVYKGTNPLLISASRFFNDITGGDNISKSDLDVEWLNPAYIEHLLSNYTGGIGKTFSNVVGSLVDLYNKDMDNITFRKIPVFGRYISDSDERIERSAVNRAYRKIEDDLKKIRHDEKGYEEAFGKGEGIEFRQRLIELQSSEKYKYFIGVEAILYNIKILEQHRKDASNDEEVKEIDDKIIELKKMVVELVEDND